MKKSKTEGWKFLLGIGVGIGIVVIIIAAGFMATELPFGNKIAIIRVQGVIASGQQLLSDTFTPEEAFYLIKKAEDDPSIKAVMFEIDSPGGSVVASREIAFAVADMNKPTLCWMGDVAASGAYWIASSCDHIMADPLTLTGSVGVTASYLEFSKLFEKYGITYEQITSGAMKDMGSPFRNLTESERGKLEYITSEIFRYFISDVSEKRKLTPAQVEEISTGDIFLGKDAVNLGLIDSTGTIKDAKDKAKELAGVKDAEFVTLQKRSMSLFDILGLLG